MFGCDLGEHLHNSGHEGKFTATLGGISGLFHVRVTPILRFRCVKAAKWSFRLTSFAHIMAEWCSILLSVVSKSLKILLSCREAEPSFTALLSPAVPQVVRSCTEFIEKHGVVDGIYRLSGISSNIQKLRFWIPYSFKADLLQHSQSGVIVFVTCDHISSVIRSI